MKQYTVKRQGRQWAVYAGSELIEGGFFEKCNAEAARAAWQALAVRADQRASETAPQR